MLEFNEVYISIGQVQVDLKNIKLSKNSFELKIVVTVALRLDPKRTRQIKQYIVSLKVLTVVEMF